MLNPAQRGCHIAGITVVSALIATAGCYHAPESVLQRMSEAQRLAKNLFLHFTQGADATDLAVMADTDAASAAFARDASQKMDMVQSDTETLRPILTGLMFSNELHFLDQFEERFAKYRALNRTILGLSVENTNLKAQRLSIGPAQESVEGFRGALEQIESGAPASDSWHIRALVTTALAAVREIEVLEASHIVEADDDAMTRLEKRMSSAEDTVRNTLTALATLVPPAARPQVLAAESVLNQFLKLHAQIIALSRHNSNVRSLALSLGELRILHAQCENHLRDLAEAVDKRGFKATR